MIARGCRSALLVEMCVVCRTANRLDWVQGCVRGGGLAPRGWRDCGACTLWYVSSEVVCTQLAQLLDSSDKRKKVQYSKIIVPIADDL
jgi:hypothetical protein